MKLPESPQEYFAFAGALMATGQDAEGVIVSAIAAGKVAGRLTELAKLCAPFLNSCESALAELDAQMKASDPEYVKHAARVEKDLGNLG